MWVWSSVSGAEIATLLCVGTMLALTIWHQRRYGMMRVGRIIGALGFSVYVAALFWYTQLPVPEVASTAWCEVYGYDSPQTTPFASFQTMVLRASEIGWGATLTSTLGLQVLLNIVLFVPWGIFLVGYFRRSIGTAVLSGVTVSFAIEVVQATGMIGLFPCAYRLGDIDDLITNSAGALLGALIAPLVMFWVPQPGRVSGVKERSRSRATGRRVTGFAMNAALVWTASTTLMLLVETVWQVVNGRIPYDLFVWLGFVMHLCTVLAVLCIPAVRGCGSFGMWVMRLAPYWVTPSGLLTAGAIPARLLRSAVVAVPLIIAGIPGLPNASVLFVLVACITLAMTPWTREHRALAGVITSSGIRSVSVGRRC